jgi:uncharacterized protein
MPINASHEYLNAEKAYLAAKSPEEKIHFTEELIKTAPKHKGTENLLKELRIRLKKLRQKEETTKKKSGKKGIKKEGFQCVLIGLPNSGKSSLLSKLTNAKPSISQNPFSTKETIIGTLSHQQIKTQVIEIPSIGSEFFDFSLVNTADLLILVIDSLQDLEKISLYTTKAVGKILIVHTKSDLLSPEKKRKLVATIKSKRLPAILISSITESGLLELKQKIISLSGAIRVFMKEPHKSKSPLPIILRKGSTVKDVAEKILKGFSKQIKETRLTGPSSKFSNQRVGLKHICKDLDIVEFHTK